MRRWAGIIMGEPASKANSRRIVLFKGKDGKPRPASIKSRKALSYAGAVALQVPVLKPMLAGRLRFQATIYYASERPDLDESVILDALAGRLYANDRQVRERHVTHAIDRKNPRAEVLVEEIGAPLLEAVAA